MRKGFLIDARGQLRAAFRPDQRFVDGLGAFPAEAAHAAVLYIGPVSNGVEVTLFGDSVPGRTLGKVLHILGLLRPKRIALTQFKEDGIRLKIFPGVWEFAEYADAPAAVSLAEPTP